MRVLITGGSGQLGTDIAQAIRCSDVEVLSTDTNNMDITDFDQVKEVFDQYKPNFVFHCAAYTDVDKAEVEKEICYKVNVVGTKNIVKACMKHDCKIVYFSTDYIFDGNKIGAYEVDDRPSPINYYGFSKYEGEIEVKKHLEKHFIFRISWVYGEHGKNFVKTILKLAKNRKEISVVDDQIGSPSYTKDIAKIVKKVINSSEYGTYHLTNEGFCSWYEFAKKIIAFSNYELSILPIKSEEYKYVASRPKNSKLSKVENKHWGKLPRWEDSLKCFIENLDMD